MKNRAYWIGLVILTLAVLAIYQWPGIIGYPRPKMHQLNFTGHDYHIFIAPGEDIAPKNEALRQTLQEVHGIKFPEGSSVHYNALGFDLLNTWPEHQKLLDQGFQVTTDPFFLNGLKLTYNHFMGYRNFWGRGYGVIQYNRMRSPRPSDGKIHSYFRPVTEIYFGTNVDTLLKSHFSDKSIYLAPQFLRYNGPAWPALLILTLVPYTLIFVLRRPVSRAIAGLFQKRRTAS